MFDRIWYWLGRNCIHAYAKTMFGMSIKRKAPLPKGPVILAANHPSTSDPILITTLSSKQLSILILDTLFKVPVMGFLLRVSGQIPVVHGSGQAALDQAHRRLKSGRSVAIFPEGVISPEGGFHRPRTGLARLALMSGAPVVPVGIHLDPKKIRRIETMVEGQPEIGTWYFRGPYAMTVGEPLTFTGEVENRDAVRLISERIMREITQLAGESARRLQVEARSPLVSRATLFMWWRFIAQWTMSAVHGIRVG